jgi:hypothetical protein
MVAIGEIGAVGLPIDPEERAALGDHPPLLTSHRLKISLRRSISPIACAAERKWTAVGEGVVIGSLMASFSYLRDTLAHFWAEHFIEFAPRGHVAASARAGSGFDARAGNVEARVASHARRL